MSWSRASASGLQSIDSSRSSRVQATLPRTDTVAWHDVQAVHAISSTPERCDRTVVLIGRTGAGKSTCANVLAGDDPKIKFKTGDESVSETKVQSEIATVHWFGKTYKVKIVDTIGIGNTRLDENEVLLRLAHACHKSKDGINAVYFVVKDRFTKEEADAWEVMCNVLLGKNIFNYTAIVRTNFRDFSDSKATFDDLRRLKQEGGEAAKRILPGIQHFIYVNNPDPLDTEQATALRAASRKKLLGHLIDNCFDVFRPPILCKIQQRISAHAQASEESTEELIELQRLNDKLKKCEDYVRRAKLEKEIEVEKRKKAEAEAKTMKEMTTIGKEQATELGIAEEYLGTVAGATGKVIDRSARGVVTGVKKLANSFM
ncbi:GTPase IMAP family member 4-like [Corticium candelabrum]|uniref:GTPase IMAP family member 4-like n=1 Tax=Corticium candelabrum TaxID=121492 RepID=UPI002E2574CE|nr:GTPase IMAP family member 4-like [Corticium candelabrum]